MDNKIRELLNHNKATIGTHLSCTWPTLWEVVGSTGQFDYCEFGSQYGAWDLHDLDNICRAAELTNLSTMIKIDRDPKEWLAQRAIAAGFQSILFADIISVEEAKECIRAVKLPPEGLNSYMGTRGVQYGGLTAYVKRLDDVVIALMIEKKPLMENLDEVLTIEGLDMIQFGPADYGLSLRTAGKPYIPADYREKVTADRDKAHQMALDAGVRPRAEAGSAEQCQYFIERGVRDFCIGWDKSMVATWCTQNGSKLREMLSIK
jgi:2-keto-3-deoxy-L-rhamnonate aldolase RhmA